MPTQQRTGAPVINLILNWPGWGSKPLWALTAAQVILVGVFSLLGTALLPAAEQRRTAQVEQMIAERRAAIRHMQQQLDAMPPFAALKMQLAEREKEKTLSHEDMPLAAAPLSRSGALLLSWRPSPRQNSHSAWLVTFRADYQGALQVLRNYIALPYVLRIEGLAMRSAEEGLHIEMSLMKPTAERRQEIE
ncbi:hypothetical protein ABRZ24_14670 [Brenneria populi]|uniref:Pilus assembly protein PilO n=1 Tax=Brenneria populi TaxID=1505588 RepID=A0ABU6JU53_9GAMM|nr:hypothetical protein [Brenneria populi Li et al. 2015]